MDASRFATTKIQPPRARGLRIERPQLERELSDALRTRRVVLLQAPAGYGKTSVLAAQVARLPQGSALAWVSLDEDDDAARLLECLACALDPYDLPWRTAPEVLAGQLDGDDAGARRAVAELVNALAAADVPHGLIVLDDLHRVQCAPVHRMLDALIERLPARWTVAITTRVAPPLALARLRAADELAELLRDDLRFTPSESAALVGAERPEAPQALADELFVRTRGWPAGLRLALAAVRTRHDGVASAAAERNLFDYLASEVLDDMPAPLHDFLLRTSVLPVLTVERAAAVAADRDAASRLDEVERRGLFATVLDGPPRALVLHDLFRDALDERLRRRHPEELPLLLRRAAAGEPDPARRVGYQLRAGDWAAAESTLVAVAEDLLVHGQTAELARLIAQFPADWRDDAPVLLRLCGLLACMRWQWSEMARLLEAAVAAAGRRGDDAERALAQAYLLAAWNGTGRRRRSEALLAELAGQTLAPRAALLVLDAQCTLHFQRAEYDRVAPLFDEVLRHLMRQPSLFAWWECSPPMSWTSLAGLRPVLDRYAATALALCGERALPMRAMLLSLQAYSHLWAGRIDEALAAVGEAESDARWLAASTEIEINNAVLRLTVDALRGDADAVRRRLDALARREDGQAAADRLRHWRHQVALYAVRIVDLLGPDPDALRRWGAHLIEVPGAPPSPLTARIAAAEGRWEAAADGFAALLPHLPRLDLMGQGVELPLRAAHALQRVGRGDAALAALRPVLARLAGGDEAGHALMAGPAVLGELAAAPWRPALDDRHAAVLTALAARSRELRTAQRPTAAPMAAADGAAPGAEALSEREREVLERIAAGDSNKLIARALDISPHTVKRHVANILDKLALASRGQAAAWLRGHTPAR